LIVVDCLDAEIGHVPGNLYDNYNFFLRMNPKCLNHIETLYDQIKKECREKVKLFVDWKPLLQTRVVGPETSVEDCFQVSFIVYF